MDPEIHSILQEMSKYDALDRPAHLSVLMARLLVLLGEEAEKNAEKAEKGTKWIVRLTWVIAILTFFLVLTSFLVLPKIAVVFYNNRTFKIETHAEEKNDKDIQTISKGSHYVPGIIKK